jgi:hypothetical protein
LYSDLAAELGDRSPDDAIEHVGGICALVEVAWTALCQKVPEALVQYFPNALVEWLKRLPDYLLDRQ